MVRIRELFLLQSDVSEAPPCVVVGLVGLERILVAFLAVLKVLVCDELVAAECVGVGEVLIQLDRSSEEFQGCFMLLLETVAIADDAPSFRREKGLLECKVAKMD